MKNINDTIFPTASADAGVTTDKVDASNVLAASFTVTTTGTIAGNVKVQASNDPCAYGNVAQNFTPTNWADVPNATATISAAGTVLVAKFDCAYRWLRVVISGVSGSGNATIVLNGLGM